MRLIPIKGKGCENLYRHPETDIIYYRQYRKGRGRCERSTFTTNLTQAKREADKYRLEFLGESKVNRGKRLNGELFPEFIEQKGIKRHRTVASIKNSWKHLGPYIKDLLPEQLTEKWWESEYIPGKRKETHKDRRFFNDCKWLTMYLLSLKREGIIERVPKLVNPDPERDAGKVYSDAEIKRLLNNAHGPLKLQILMAVTMGMRKSEILKLSWDRVDFKRQTIHLRSEDTKTGKSRTFGISKPVWAILKGMDRTGSPYVFPSAVDSSKPLTDSGNQTAWKTCKRRAKVEGRFHDLRHTFLTNAFKSKDANPALICFYAGLSLEEAQKTYLHFDFEDTRVVATIGGNMGESWLAA